MRRIRRASQWDHCLRLGHRGRLVGLAIGALFVLLHSALPAGAAEGVWSGGLPEGGSVYDIVAAPADPLTLWVAASSNGVFKSVDGGATWARANDGVTPYVRALAVTRVGSTVALYAVSTSSITPEVWKSLDGGDTWSSSGAGLEGTWPYDVAAPPGDLTTVYCVTRQDGVFKSTDGGASFAPSNVGLPDPLPSLYTLTVDPVNPSILYLGFNQSNPGGVYKSTDAGATWSASNTGIESARIRQIVIDPATPSTLYVTAGSSDRLYKSTDSGATWAPAATGLTPNHTPTALAIDPSTPTTLYVAVSPGIFRSVDGAANWSDLGVPLQGASVGALLVEASVAPLAPEGGTPLLWAGTSYGVLRSTDGGANWPESNSGLEAYLGDVVSDPSQPATVYASDLSSGMIKTVDGGTNWARINNGLTSVSLSMYLLDESVIAPSDPDVLYISRTTEIYRTDNGGGFWSSTITDPGPFGDWGVYVTAIAVNPVSASTVLAGNEAQAFDGFPDVGPAILRSTDSGATWSVLYTPPWVPPFGGYRFLDPVSIVIDPTDSNRIYFSSFSSQSGVPGWAWSVLRSTDGGANWSEELTGTNSLVYLAIDPVTPMTLYAGVNGFSPVPSGLFKSIDGGDTWNFLTLPETFFGSIAHSPRQSGRLWVGSESIYESLDGGVSWSEMDTSGLPSDFHRVYSLAATDSDPITLYAGTNAGVYGYTEEEAPIIFSDGFESGNTSAWSITVP